MKQSKIPAALLAATLLLSLAACGQDQGDTEPTPTADTVQIGLLLPGQEEDPYDQNHIQATQLLLTQLELYHKSILHC